MKSPRKLIDTEVVLLVRVVIQKKALHVSSDSGLGSSVTYCGNFRISSASLNLTFFSLILFLKPFISPPNSFESFAKVEIIRITRVIHMC